MPQVVKPQAANVSPTRKRIAADRFQLSRRRSAVRQPHPSRPELAAQEPVFDDQVGDDFAFAALEPTGEHQEQPLESRGVQSPVLVTSPVLRRSQRR